MAAAIIFAHALAVPRATRATVADDICAPAANPCVVDVERVIESGSLLDFGSRALVIRRTGKVSLAPGPGRRGMQIRAGSLEIQPGGAILGTGLPATPTTPGSEGGIIDVTTTGNIRVQAGSAAKGRIDASGDVLGGAVDLSAGGSIEIAGVVSARGLSTQGLAGDVDLSAAGSLTIASSGEVAASGGKTSAGSGGFITMAATGITINGPVESTGGDCSACSIDLDARAGVLVTTQRLDVSATAAGGDAGEIILAGNSVTIGGPINGQGAGSDVARGGIGGVLSVDAVQDVNLNARINVFGAAPDGDGGSADITAGTDITQTQPIQAQANGDTTIGCGSPFEVFFRANRDIVLGEINVRGGTCGGGTVRAEANGTVTLQRDINADGGNGGPGGTIDVTGQRIAVVAPANLHADGSRGALGGVIRFEGCLVSVPARTRLSTLGNASATGGINRLRASGELFSIGGTLLAGSGTATGLGQNLLEFRTRTPSVEPGASILPLETVVQNGTLTACRRCGNGMVDAEDGEECDPPDPVKLCSTSCRLFRCGNAIIDPGEECDPGNSMVDCDADGCSTLCRREACGNGVTQCSEGCDTGTTTACDQDGCSASCQPERCGNATVECNEECDDGELNGPPPARCSRTCRLAPPPDCGNGMADRGEECDDGNTVSEDGCSSVCQREECGDNIVQAGLGEQCDDANTLPCDGCSPTCQVEGDDMCGNGVVECTEVCDDGNTQGCDGCSSTCTSESCGNGVVDCGEECDDREPTEHCTATCRMVTCRVDTDCDERGACGLRRCQAPNCVRNEPPDCSPGICVTDGAGTPQCRYECSRCPDDDVCNGVEACDPTSGDCLPSTALPCDPFCAPCERTRGCVPATGTASVSCQLDAAEAALAGAPADGITPAVGAKLRRGLQKVRAKLAAAQQTGKAKRVAKLLGVAAKAVAKVQASLRAAERKGGIEPSLALLIRERLGRAASAIEPLRRGGP
jgi:cysteine-rich repeat protein